MQGSGTVRQREIERRETAEPNKTLFVVNFQPETTQIDDLRDFFSQWGELERIQLKTKFAFIEVSQCNHLGWTRRSTLRELCPPGRSTNFDRI